MQTLAFWLSLLIWSAQALAAQPTTSSALNRFAQQTLTWRPCYAEAECATLRVPTDYAQPDGPEWLIAVARYRASSETARRGVLFTNPGGPGIPGIPDLGDYPRFWDALRTRYDVVTVDPRGTGQSYPKLECLTPEDKTAIRNQVSNPSMPGQIQLARQLGRLQGESCRKKYGRQLALFSTRNVARDMDVLRSALGERQLSYLGFSYGTYLGTTYAELFPQRTDRMVLDSAMNPALDYRRLRHDQALGFQHAIERFVTDCHRQPDCPLPAGHSAGLEALERVVTTMDQTPFVAPDGRELSGSRTLNLIESSMYQPETGWPHLKAVIGPALAGSYQPMLDMAYSSAMMVNPADSPYLAVMCHDLQTTRHPGAPRQLAKQWRKQASLTGAGRAWSLQPCETWPVKSAWKPRPMSAKGSGQILIVAGQHDPATPITWARALHRTLAHAALLEWQGDGHIGYGRAGACVDDAVERFLLQGIAPPAQAECP